MPASIAYAVQRSRPARSNQRCGRRPQWKSCPSPLVEVRVTVKDTITVNPTELNAESVKVASKQPEAEEPRSTKTSLAIEVHDEPCNTARTAKVSPMVCTSTAITIESDCQQDSVTMALGVEVALSHMCCFAQQPERMTCFHCVRDPGVGLGSYLDRVRTYFGCGSECFVIALLYIDRLHKLHPQIAVSKLSVHRLLITSMVLAAKFHDDLFFTNAHYAKIGGIRVEELNALERRFCQLLDWRLHVRPEEFEMYHAIVQKAAAARRAAGHDTMSQVSSNVQATS